MFRVDSKQSPDNARLYYFLGNAQIAVHDRGETDQATSRQFMNDGIANLQKCLSVYPEYGQAQSSLSDAFMVTNQLDSAEVHGKQALQLIPRDATAMNVLATVYIGKKKYDDAILLCSKAMSINPENSNYPGNIAVSYIFKQQYDSAVHYFKKAIALDPTNTRSLKFIAVAYNAAGKTDSAKKYEAIVRQSEPGFSINSIPLPK